MPINSNYSIHALELGPMENFIYLIHDHDTNTAAIVDPAWDVEEVLDIARSKDIQITDILLTHCHHDHINNIHTVLKHYDAQIHLLHEENRFWKPQLAKPALHYGGDTIKLGNSQIEILHTPGHTTGSACYRLGDDLITGDTMFVFGCGHCKLAGSDPNVLYDTLRKMKTELPGNITLHPGHNYSPKHPTSTLTEQIEGNPFLHFDKKADFIKYRMHIHDLIRDAPYEAISVEDALKSIS